MKKSFITIMALCLATQAVGTTFAEKKCSKDKPKCETPRKGQRCEVGTWLLNLEALGEQGEVLFMAYNIISFAEDGRVIEHSSADIVQKIPFIAPAGNYATIGLGSWRCTGKLESEAFLTRVFNVKDVGLESEHGGNPTFRQVLQVTQVISKHENGDIIFNGEGFLQNYAIDDIKLENPIGPKMRARAFARKLTFENLPA